MGNCVRKEASTEWGGDDWSSPSALAAEKQEEKGGFESSGGRRELLADLMNAARHCEIETHHRHASAWRPSLQTIPEL
nr:uncharacterized protein LOC109178037 [Ipomoea batatas]